MASGSGNDPGSYSAPHQSIPLRDLTSPSDASQAQDDDRRDGRGRNLLPGGYNSRYERLDDVSPAPIERAPMPGSGAGARTMPGHRRDDSFDEAPIDAASFQAALGFEGFSMPSSRPEPARLRSASSDRRNFDGQISPYSYPYGDYHDEGNPYFQQTENDKTPLTDARYLQPISGTQAPEDGENRTSFTSVRFDPSGSKTGSRLGDDLSGVEAGFGRSRSHSLGEALSPGGLTRNRSVMGGINRAGSVVRAMSQRVVNLSSEPLENNIHRHSSVPDQPRSSMNPLREEIPYPPEMPPPQPFEKQPVPIQRRPVLRNNPLKGKTLGIFGPENPIRLKLCEVLIHPFTEPFILLLIVVQTIVLTIDAVPSVFDHPRPQNWGGSWTDWALLILFAIYTAEIVARIIVSGFIHNAPEYSTIDRNKGLKNTILERYRYIFSPQRHESVKANQHNSFAPPIMRSFTMQPHNATEQHRHQLARRAFLRHSFNRLDFIAVVSFWVSFGLSITGIEARRHLYVFEMMSSLRTVRLLAMTNGTTIILKSLKKAAPSLLNVSFLIGFFWLLFAIVGIQSFKSSLSRQCLWMDPEGIQASFNNDFTFCGGYLDNVTGDPLPWVYDDFTPGATKHKGFLCPRQSVCMQQSSPYNGTMNFDNIVQSLELVFVLMSGNTFSDLLYYTTNSDYLAAALFFAAGMVILTFWLMNLLIAVITSSFQVIREEGKASAFTALEQPLHTEDQTAVPRKISTLKRLYDNTFWFWICAIIVDLFIMAFRSSTMSPRTANIIDNSENAVTILLLAEIFIRFASDWRVFHRSASNWMDLTLAVITSAILIPPIRNSGEAYAWLTVFQILRIYRVVLAIPMTRKLILLVLGNATGIANLVLFVFLITFLAAILASQLFRGDLPQYDDSGNTIEVSFFNIWNSFIGMYQILSSENWTSILYNVTAYDNYLNIGWIGATFLIGWFLVANAILVNMFIAVIQENFDVSEDEKRLQQVKAFLQRKELGTASSNISLSAILTLGRSNRKKDPLDYGPATMEMLLKDAVVRDFLDEEDIDPLQESPVQENAQQPTKKREGESRSLWQRFWNREPNPFYSNLRFTGSTEGLNARAMAKEAVSATSQRKKAQREYLARHPNYNVSLFIFRPNNFIRKMCQKVVGPGRGHERIEGVEPNRILWYSFSALIYAAILAMVLLACVTTPLYQKEYFETHVFNVKNWFVWTDLGFAVLFSIEALIKIVADGLYWTPNAYLRSVWGMIDALVLITLWINVSTSLMNDGAVSRSVGAFKALRALRLLNVSDSARNTLHSVIIVGGLKVLSAAFVSMALLIPFAIYGVNLFNGKLLSCNDGSDNIANLVDCFGEYNSTPYNTDWPMLAPRSVSNPYYSFDDFSSSLFILFQIVSQEGWIDVMNSAMSITGNGLQPQDFASQGNAVFFIIFNLLANVFILTLFISVFMRNYTEQTGVAFLTADQRSWLELRKLLRQISPSKRPSNKRSEGWKDWCYKRAVKKHGRWHRAMTYVLVLHLILLVLEFYPEPLWWDRTRDFIFLGFTVFYSVNILVRIVGLTWTRFRRSSWDLFSLLSVTGTMITTILLLSDFNSQIYIQLHKLFLVSITLLLIPRNNALDQLFKTAAASLNSIANLLATWFVLFLVFAIAMTQTFGLTRFGDNEDDNVNFRTVPKALILLFRMSCGEGWNQVMEDFAGIEPPLCVEGTSFFDSDCGSSNWARALFIAWNILSMYIFVSLFVSLIYESFSYVYQRHSGHAIVSREEIRRFKQAWATFDPEGTGFISKENFPRLLGELSGIFALRIYDEQDSVRRILEDINYDPTNRRTHSIAGSIRPASISPSDINLKALNERLNQLDVRKIRQRRRKYNLFYEEVMVSADPDRGIAFTSVLMILAHHNIISDSKSLRLEEFLRRRARMHRVEEEVQRRTVVRFFDMIYWTRYFRKWKKRYDTARMTNIPTFDVPEILVEDEAPPKQKSAHQTPFLSPVDTSVGSPRHAYSQHGRQISNDSLRSPHSPNSPARSPTLHPQHAHGGSAYSFEYVDGASPGSGPSSRRGSSVNADDVLESLDNSAWGESIRRSFTMRRPQK